MLKLGEKGTNVSFNNNSAAVITRDGTKILTATRVGQLYAIDTTNWKLNAFAMETQGSVASFDTWHQQLGHAGVDSVKELITKRLVDGLNTNGELVMRGRCEDCIFGKHSTHLFNKPRLSEDEVLERVHIDIWGPARTQLAGGALYFLIIMVL